jgi:hypothetical protein
MQFRFIEYVDLHDVGSMAIRKPAISTGWRSIIGTIVVQVLLGPQHDGEKLCSLRE